ncbi:nucleotide pyrophosphohydrolase [Bacillus thuringiensis]|uniref:MazG-like family protein n=1 Tax=Bacillus thuringiensis TaxID=1428 RepID=UPI000BF9BD8E|nr:MazG-like family protein [Bacillus thuringiensis]PFW01720.1 nucleotide pyrophosphohydrolase [Bacillus thuringiensis]
MFKLQGGINWRWLRDPKDLAISPSLEASELLENFQWKCIEEAVEKNFENIKGELVDVLIYSIRLADQIDVDIEEMILNKTEKNEKEYSVEKAYGFNKKYDEL